MSEERSGIESVFIVGPTESALTTRGNRHPSLAAFLVSIGYGVAYVSSNFSHAEKRYFTNAEIQESATRVPYDLIIFRTLGYGKNISVRRVLHNFLFSLRTFIWLLPRVSRRNAVILPSRPVELIFFMGLLRKLRGCSVVLDIQDVWPDALDIKSERKRWAFEKYCNAFLRPSLKWIDRFVHVAPSFLNWLHRYHPDANSTFVPLGFDAPRWAGVTPLKSKKLSEPVNLVCVGMLQYQVDVMPILEALSERSDYQLTIIGEDGAGERYPEVMAFVNENKLGNVTVEGRVPPAEMPACLENADIGVVPMITSSIPNKVFDYLGAYLPILVLGHNDSGRLVESAGIGWQVDYTAEGVSRFLDSLTPEDYRRKQAKLGECRDQYDRESLFSAFSDMISPHSGEAH
jgi:hypothetical protein